MSSVNANLSVLATLHPGTVSAAVTVTSATWKDSTTHGALVWRDKTDTWQLTLLLTQTHRCWTPTPDGRSVVDNVIRVDTSADTWTYIHHLSTMSHGLTPVLTLGPTYAISVQCCTGWHQRRHLDLHTPSQYNVARVDPAPPLGPTYTISVQLHLC